jgi:hypothetical protein
MMAQYLGIWAISYFIGWAIFRSCFSKAPFRPAPASPGSIGKATNCIIYSEHTLSLTDQRGRGCGAPNKEADMINDAEAVMSFFGLFQSLFVDFVMDYDGAIAGAVESLTDAQRQMLGEEINQLLGGAASNEFLLEVFHKSGDQLMIDDPDSLRELLQHASKILRTAYGIAPPP